MTEENKYKHILEMFTVAGEYCHYMESCPGYPFKETMAYLQKLIPLMYLKGAMLSPLSIDEDVINERYVTEIQYEDMYMNLKDYFGESDRFDALHEDEITTFSLAELLADIWQDMKDFVLLFQHPISSARLQAAENIRLWYHERWGFTAIRILEHLHLHNARGEEEDTEV